MRAYLDAGVSHARPPSNVEADAATYAQLGGRLRAGPFFLSAYGGAATGGAAADWIGGALGAFAGTSIPGSGRLTLTGVVSAFRLGEPTPYEALTARVIPEARLAAGLASLALRGYAGLGRSQVEDLTLDPPEELEADLWMYGAGVELSRPLARLRVWGGGEAYSSADGEYVTGYAGSSGPVGRAVWRAELRVWHTPDDPELQLGLQLTIPLGGAWSTELAAGRSGPDPLLNSPAGVDASLTLTWNALTVSTSAPPLYTLSEAPAGDPTALKGEPREVLFRLQHPGAESVSVIGDFSDWRPLPMRRKGAAWIVQARVTPGVYHFGFLVDGEWHVPEEATGLVTDEFGRANATLVVPRR